MLETTLHHEQDQYLENRLISTSANTCYLLSTVLLWLITSIANTQLIFTCSKSKVETLEKGVKYVQSYTI